MANFGRGDYNLLNTDEDPIPPEEPVMLLRGQDTAAYLTVRFYALIVEILFHNPKLAARAREHAERMKEWPTKKNPDMPKNV